MLRHGVWIVCVVSLTIAGLSGCGYQNPLGRQAVSGKVIVDGRPLPRGNISFTPKDNITKVRSGAVISDGNYALPTEKGLPPGEYVVSIRAVQRSENSNPDLPPGSEKTTLPMKQPIPAKYNAKSELLCEVTAGGSCVFDLRSRRNKDASCR